MNPEEFANSPAGRIQHVQGPGGPYAAFVPNTPPASFAKLRLPPDLTLLIAEAENALGRLAGFARTLPALLPQPDLLIIPQIRLEAAASTRIEGTLISTEEVQRYEVIAAPQERQEDFAEVQAYIGALNHGLQLVDGGMPISVRLAREVHRVLMQGGPAGRRSRTPGKLRRVQNYIGPPGSTVQNARYVPPPPDLVPGLLTDWERAANRHGVLPLLVQGALLHYQFEAIHPFDDGNGRVGRLLFKLMLHERRALPYPLLNLSGYFERHRSEYQDCLLEVSRSGGWARWLQFFLRGCSEQSEGAYANATAAIALRESYRQALERSSAPASAYSLLDLLFLNPTITARHAEQRLGISLPTALKAIETLEELGVLIDDTPERQRGKVYTARGIQALYA